MLFKMSASKMNFVEKKKNLDRVLLAGTVRALHCDDEKYLDMPGRKRITLTVMNQISPVSLYVMLRRLGHSI